MTNEVDISTIEIMTEDDTIVKHGDRVYNYYDMVPGTIELRPSDVSNIPDDPNIKVDIWFEFKPDGGGVTILNGQRICSMDFARSRGFRSA